MRFSLDELSPEGFQAMMGMEKYIRATDIPKELMELIKVRASVLNGCAYCMDMHTEEALQLGVSDRKLFAVAVWHESPLFKEEERAVLQLTDEVTLIADNALTDETYDEAVNHFGEEMVAKLIMQIVIINSWNRIAVASKSEYEPKNNKK